MPLTAAFLTATALVSLSPGANALTVVDSAVRQGFPRALRVVAGQLLALASHMALAAAGAAALAPGAFLLMKACGAAYLLWIGAALLRTKPSAEGSFASPFERPLPGFWRGYLIGAINPKALLFQAAFVPQFLVPEIPFSEQYLSMGPAMLGIEALAMSGYAGLAARARPWLASPSCCRNFDRACGALFIGLSLAMAVSGFA